ncbi:hypothetical protein M8I34_14395 [Streptomyces sp. MCA2]|nr:sigma factor [Streptomyces sp. MCA2]MCL7492613.1 hypothetical protein [Streptomyces sp. MCA2]
MASPTECTIGLIKAIDRYDVSRGVEFTTLAVPYIQGEIKRFFCLHRLRE